MWRYFYFPRILVVLCAGVCVLFCVTPLYFYVIGHVPKIKVMTMTIMMVVMMVVMMMMMMMMMVMMMMMMIKCHTVPSQRCPEMCRCHKRSLRPVSSLSPESDKSTSSWSSKSAVAASWRCPRSTWCRTWSSSRSANCCSWPLDRLLANWSREWASLVPDHSRLLPAFVKTAVQSRYKIQLDLWIYIENGAWYRHRYCGTLIKGNILQFLKQSELMCLCAVT